MPETNKQSDPGECNAEDLAAQELGLETEATDPVGTNPSDSDLPEPAGEQVPDVSPTASGDGLIQPTTEAESKVAEPEAATALADKSVASSPVKYGSASANKVSLKQIDTRVVLLVVLLVLLLLGWAGAGVYEYLMKKQGSSQQASTSAPQVTKKLGVAAGLLEGTVEYATDKGVTWQQLTDKTTLAEGNQIRTSANGRAVLLLDDGSAMRLAGNSSIELTNLSTTTVVITQLSGELYSRVVASDTRTYSVSDNGVLYVAKGTAFRTSNTAAKKGVEVFHSAVAVDGKTVEVPEGSAYYSLCDQKEKQDVVSAIDLAALKKDDFIKWNSEQDKKAAEYADTLGVLTELDKPDPAPPVVAPTPTQKTTSGITLKGSVSEYSAVFSWKVAGVDTAKGFKLVKSSSSKTPTYPDNYAAYIESGKTSYNLYLGDGKTYYFRLCAYRGDSCDSYSNTVTVSTPKKSEAPKDDGTITLSLNGSLASWTYTGSEPYGFKLVVNTTGSPTYPESNWKYVTGALSSTLPDGLTSGTKYYVRVCKYFGTCTVYSNELTYTAP